MTLRELGYRSEAGAGAYYARQTWGFGRTVDAWAATIQPSSVTARRWHICFTA